MHRRSQPRPLLYPNLLMVGIRLGISGKMVFDPEPRNERARLEPPTFGSLGSTDRNVRKSEDGDNGSIKDLRQVNEHWGACATGAVTALNLHGDLPLQHMVDVIR